MKQLSHSDPRDMLGLCSTTLKLATPALIQQGLQLLGASWNAATMRIPGSGPEHGLYTWTTSQAKDPMHNGILYVGIGENQGGVWDRIDAERKFSGDHGHRLAIDRNRALVVAGSVTLVDPDLSFVTELIETEILASEGKEKVANWRSTMEAAPLKAIEHFAIRLCMHLGDVGPAVNSQHAGAWANDSDADWTAYAVARELERQAGASKK